MSEKPEEPKIVVDEDWKSRVQAEKQAAEAVQREQAGARPEQGQKHGQGQQEAQAQAPEEPAGRREHATGPLPPAAFPVLVSSLAAQALTAMGRFPDPVEGHAVVRPDWAKHYIDMLGMLEEKTKGNLASEESAMLSDVLHELRMAFVTTRKQPEASG